MKPVRAWVVFSAHAEVFRPPGTDCAFRSSLLRTCGGIPDAGDCVYVGAESSPRTRRYSRVSFVSAKASMVFSAHAEVFLEPRNLDDRSGVFSAHAEVFRRRGRPERETKRLLRTGGGIPSMRKLGHPEGASSPPTRRYPSQRGGTDVPGEVFSAHAEVSLARTSSRGAWFSLLRTRGGIPREPSGRARPLPSSPQTRRYPLFVVEPGRRHQVFSAHAEVSLKSFACLETTDGLLRTRGGIPSESKASPRGNEASLHTRR